MKAAIYFVAFAGVQGPINAIARLSAFSLLDSLLLDGPKYIFITVHTVGTHTE